MVNPKSGHTRAESGTTNAEGLRDGDVILSPSLTNPYEAFHGNGILREQDGAYGASNRNSVGSGTPGFVAVGSSQGEIVVSGGYASIDGTVYEFAGGPGGSHSFIVGTATNYSGSLPSVPSANEDVMVVIYLDSTNTQKHLKYEMGSSAAITSGTPLVPTQYLSDPGRKGSSAGSGSNQQHVVLAVVRYTMSSGAGSVTASLSTGSAVEVHDRRVFLRPGPLFLSHMTKGATGNVTASNAVDGMNQNTLNTLFSGTEAGDFTNSPFGAIWQSHSPDGHSVLYYSASRNIGTTGARNTWRLAPNEVKVISTSANQTFTFDGPNIWLITAGAGLNLNPSGEFPDGHIIEVTATTNTVTFDSTDLNQAVAAGKYGRFVYQSEEAAATATVTVAAGKPSAGEQITLISSDGTSITYTAKAGSEDLADNKFTVDGSNSDVAESLEECIEHANGHNGRITVSRSSNVLTLTQAVLGTAGNTTITENLSNTTAPSFANGTGQWRKLVVVTG